MVELETLKNLLKKGEVEFSYTKKDGSIRTARGTTNVSIVSEHNATPKGELDYSNDTVTRYYDLNSEGWRSFKNENFVEILN